MFSSEILNMNKMANIIKRADERECDPLELSVEFCQEFLTDMADLQCLPPTVQPRVSDHMTMPFYSKVEQEVAATVESMEKAARYTSNKYVEAALNSTTIVLPYLVPFILLNINAVNMILVLPIHSLEGYIDASCLSNAQDNSLKSGCVFLLWGGAISCDFKKQDCISISTMEYDHVALAATSKEVKLL
ncbi:zinc finger, CCHC-type containing protein [Tanacetum coccineum]